MEFPVPFSGATWKMDLRDKEVPVVVTHLLNCGHRHNYLIQMDADFNGTTIILSELGKECAFEALGLGR